MIFRPFPSHSQVSRKSSKLNPMNIIYHGTDKKKEGEEDDPYIPLFTIINWRFLLKVCDSGISFSFVI